MKGSIAIAMLLLTGACMAQPGAVDSASTSYLEAALRFPTYFTLTSGEFRDTWGRIRPWLIETAGAEIASMDDEEIRTRPKPTLHGNSCALRVSSEASFGGWRIRIETLCQGPDNTAGRNAHLLAYYLATGKPTPTSLILH